MGTIVGSGTRFINWNMTNREGSRNSLFITAAIYLVISVGCTVYIMTSKNDQKPS